MANCFVCERRVIPPSGYSKSKVLIIGDSPGVDEIKRGLSFVGQTGQILRKELAERGYDALRARVCNMWYHSPNKNEVCFEASINVCLAEAKDKDAILLVGAETVKYFTDYKVSEVNGLQVDSNQLSAPVIFAMMQPTILFHGKGLGEITFALDNFVDYLEKENII